MTCWQRSSLRGWLLAVMLACQAGCARRPFADGNGETGSGGTPIPTGEGGDLFVGGGGAPACAGACVPAAAGPFTRVTMVSIGKPEDVRPCPEWAPDVGFEGFADMMVEPHSCPACSCGPAACALPEAMHASAAKCPGEGAPSTAWDAPPAWEGVCSSEDPIPAGLQCAGVPCVQSITIDAPAVEPCKPAELGAANIPAPAWATMARECKIRVDDEGGGCDHGQACAPVPPEGFVLCLSVAGDGYECPEDYPENFLVFDGVEDDRECSPCSCSEPEGADCAALVSVFSDGACGMLLGSYMLANDEPGCFDLPSGSALASKSAGLIVDAPGSCTPTGGGLTGAVKPVGPITLCCQKSAPDPAK